MDVGGDDKVLARLQPSIARRVLGAGCLVALAVLFLSLAFEAASQSAVAATVFLVLGAGSAFISTALWRASGQSVELTRNTLRDSSGRTLAIIPDVLRVERGAFAFKPTHGFVLTTRQSGPRAMVPGLWWRIGRKVGVGGTAPPGEARFMAEMISGLINPVEPPD